MTLPRSGRSLSVPPVLERKPRKSYDHLIADQAKPVPLHVAASVVHQQLVTSSRDWMDEHYDAILDSTALALSNVSDIYCVRNGRLARIPEEELAVGMFRRRREALLHALGQRLRNAVDAPRRHGGGDQRAEGRARRHAWRRHHGGRGAAKA